MCTQSGCVTGTAQDGIWEWTMLLLVDSSRRHINLSIRFSYIALSVLAPTDTNISLALPPLGILGKILIASL